MVGSSRRLGDRVQEELPRRIIIIIYTKTMVAAVVSDVQLDTRLLLEWELFSRIKKNQSTQTVAWRRSPVFSGLQTTNKGRKSKLWKSLHSVCSHCSVCLVDFLFPCILK